MSWYTWLSNVPWYPEFIDKEHKRLNPPHPQPSEILVVDNSILTDVGLPQSYRTDAVYKLISRIEFEKWIAYDEVDKEKYISNFYDCENFASDLCTFANRWVPGIAIGEMWLKSRNHSVNVLITIDKKVWHVEPQNDMIKPCDLTDIYFMRF